MPAAPQETTAPLSVILFPKYQLPALRMIIINYAAPFKVKSMRGSILLSIQPWRSPRFAFPRPPNLPLRDFQHLPYVLSFECLNV